MLRYPALGFLLIPPPEMVEMDRSCPERQDYVPPLRRTEEANCQVPRVPQPPAVATRISHYASNYVLGPVSGVLLVRTRV